MHFFWWHIMATFLLWHYLENAQLLFSTYQVAGLSSEQGSKEFSKKHLPSS